MLRQDQCGRVHFDDDGGAYLADFGIAKALNQSLTAETLFTRIGALVGTPEYVSPEQALSSGEDIDTRADVYSLGLLLYELVLGAHPFSAETDELRLTLQLYSQPQNPRLRWPEIPLELEMFLLRLLAARLVQLVAEPAAPCDERRFEQMLARLSIATTQVDAALARGAATVRARTGLRLPDAYVLATALQAERQGAEGVRIETFDRSLARARARLQRTDTT